MDIIKQVLDQYFEIEAKILDLIHDKKKYEDTGRCSVCFAKACPHCYARRDWSIRLGSVLQEYGINLETFCDTFTYKGQKLVHGKPFFYLQSGLLHYRGSDISLREIIQHAMNM